jgi:hypothetical protein
MELKALLVATEWLVPFLRRVQKSKISPTDQLPSMSSLYDVRLSLITLTYRRCLECRGSLHWEDGQSRSKHY